MPLNRGFYTVDIRFFYKIECEISCAVGRPRIIDGLSVFDKRVVLFGGEGGARIFSSNFVDNGMDVQLCPDSNKPKAVVEVVPPVLLDARVVPPETCCNCCCCAINEIPSPICSCFEGDDIVLDNNGYQLFVTLGQFAIIRLERDIQLLMPAYDICLPRRDCSNSGVGGTEQDPCAIFENFEFPIDEFFPPQSEFSGCMFTGNTENDGCGCGNGCGNVSGGNNGSSCGCGSVSGSGSNGGSSCGCGSGRCN